MAELTIEQKAEAYDKALSIAKGLYAKDAPDSLHLERMFPELKEESEDEKIRKEIYWFFTQPDTVCDKRWIAWLEKQGEQKPTWSGKDEETILKMMFALKSRVFPSSEECNSFIEFLKSLKNKVQPRQNWSDEDECYMSGFLNLTDD